MYTIKNILTAVSLTALTAAGTASATAAPRHDNWNHRDFRHEVRHPIVVRERIFDSLRLHHYRGFGTPTFVRGHYVVKSINRFGRVVFVEVNPYTGVFLGEFRI